MNRPSKHKHMNDPTVEGQVRQWRRNADGLTHDDLHVTEVDPAFEAVVDDLMALPEKERIAAARALDDARVYRYGDLGQACLNRQISAHTRAVLAGFRKAAER